MKKNSVFVFVSIFLCLLLANCAGPAQLVKNEPITNKDGSKGRVVVTEQVKVNPIEGFFAYWYKNLCLEVWESDYVIPDYPKPPTAYERAKMERLQELEAEDEQNYESAETERGIKDAEKEYGYRQ